MILTWSETLLGIEGRRTRPRNSGEREGCKGETSCPPLAATMETSISDILTFNISCFPLNSSNRLQLKSL